MKRVERLIKILLLVVFPASIMGGLQAHELRPSVADISRSGQSVQIELRTNLEALISEIGGEHDDSTEAPQSEHYQQLRELAPDALKTELGQYLPILLSGTSLAAATADATSLPLSLGTVSIPPVGDTELARESVLRFEAAITDDINAVIWQWNPRYGSIILRAQTVMNQDSAEPDVTSIGLDVVPPPDSTADRKATKTPGSSTTPSAFTQYLLPGKRSDPLGIAPESDQSGGPGLAVFILSGLVASLAIVAIGFYRFRKPG